MNTTTTTTPEQSSDTTGPVAQRSQVMKLTDEQRNAAVMSDFAFAFNAWGVVRAEVIKRADGRRREDGVPDLPILVSRLEKLLANGGPESYSFVEAVYALVWADGAFELRDASSLHEAIEELDGLDDVPLEVVVVGTCNSEGAIAIEIYKIKGTAKAVLARHRAQVAAAVREEIAAALTQYAEAPPPARKLVVDGIAKNFPGLELVGLGEVFCGRLSAADLALAIGDDPRWREDFGDGCYQIAIWDTATEDGWWHIYGNPWSFSSGPSCAEAILRAVAPEWVVIWGLTAEWVNDSHGGGGRQEVTRWVKISRLAPGFADDLRSALDREVTRQVREAMAAAG